MTLAGSAYRDGSRLERCCETAGRASDGATTDLLRTWAGRALSGLRCWGTTLGPCDAVEVNAEISA